MNGKEPLRIRRINSTDEGALRQLSQLRDQLRLNANIISEKGRQLTEAVFGEALSPAKVVERICLDVRARGLEAVLHYTEQFDKAHLTPQTLRVSAEELKAAYHDADFEFLETIQRVKQNILAFQSGLLHGNATLSVAGLRELKVRYRPVRRVGICVPGGSASYPSTLLMTVCPARAAGVKEIAVVLPPTANGAYNRELLAACYALGVNEVYRIGGAQAVAAMAYGVVGLPAVDMIVGPGNIFVTLAKKFVFGEVSIDCLAGPSEIVVIADDTAPAAFVASDLIAQAEHDPATSILLTWHEPLLDAVKDALEEQLMDLDRAEAAQRCLEDFGALVLVRDIAEAVKIANEIGPEHLHIATRDAEEIADRIDNAGAIFLGNYTPVALGDYAAGPSHVLPTGGTARFASGLSANDFLRRSSVLRYSRPGMVQLSSDVCRLAEKEGLTGHAASVQIRLAKPVAADAVATRNGHGAAEMS